MSNLSEGDGQLLQYRTKDLTEATFIWCQKGAKLSAVEAQHVPSSRSYKSDTFFFRFTLDMTDEDLKKLLFDYANEDTRIEPQMFARKQNNLRDRLYAVKKRKNNNGDFR